MILKNYKNEGFMESILDLHGITKGKTTLESPC